MSLVIVSIFLALCIVRIIWKRGEILSFYYIFNVFLSHHCIGNDGDERRGRFDRNCQNCRVIAYARLKNVHYFSSRKITNQFIVSIWIGTPREAEPVQEFKFTSITESNELLDPKLTCSRVAWIRSQLIAPMQPNDEVLKVRLFAFAWTHPFSWRRLLPVC